jgi:hypothetical protein
VCSGAVGFLLNRNQPASVQQCDFGKAIAIHYGAHIVSPNATNFLTDPALRMSFQNGGIEINDGEVDAVVCVYLLQRAAQSSSSPVYR